MLSPLFSLDTVDWWEELVTESPMVLVSYMALSVESVSDTVSLVESPMESVSDMVSLVELECTTATLATTEPPSSTLLSLVKKASQNLDTRNIYFILLSNKIIFLNKAKEMYHSD